MRPTQALIHEPAAWITADRHLVDPADPPRYEAANGRFKSGRLDIGDPKHRPAPGQVTQALLRAVMLTIANLTVLETWLTERDAPDELTDADFNASGPLPPHTAHDMTCGAPTGHPPPPRVR
ncbi:hypothetical protein [Streptomyces cucumeris]|uniref:hypothetical protein n=1 Tax=Streptomyces cucumeris TaxID=2962890 RepID=UPI003D7306C2